MRGGAAWEFLRLGQGGSQASVTIRTHGGGPFSFSFGGLRLCIFFLLEEMRGAEGRHWLGTLAHHPVPPVHWPRGSPRHCWSQTLPQHWGAGQHSSDSEGWTELPSAGSWVA